MTKKLRQEIYNKFDGCCAYTGKPLGTDWQVDHMTSKIKHEWQTFYRYSDLSEIKDRLKEVHNVENLVPTIKIVNHYKRSLDLEGFRKYMLDFHKRLAKLPKTTSVPRTQKRKEYLFKVAELFGITVDTPFKGIFHFETINRH